MEGLEVGPEDEDDESLLRNLARLLPRAEVAAFNLSPEASPGAAPEASLYVAPTGERLLRSTPDGGALDYSVSRAAVLVAPESPSELLRLSGGARRHLSR